jgi:DNA-directed RNA polymerase specialized sigma24 family protein
VLASKFALHDVRDAVALCGNVIAKSGLKLDHHQHEDLLAFLLEECWLLSLRYERGRGSTSTFAGWASYILRRRVVDWLRAQRGRGYRPEIVSLEIPSTIA